MKKRDSFLKTIFLGLFSLVSFFVILGVANVLKELFPNQIFSSIVIFFNLNVSIIVTLSILFLFAKLSDLFLVPLNLFAPFFNAVGAGFLILFLLRIFEFIFVLVGITTPEIFNWIYSGIVPLILFVAIIIFIIGYFKILVRLFKKEEQTKRPRLKRRDEVEWEEVGIQFRMMLNDLIKKIRKKLS